MAEELNNIRLNATMMAGLYGKVMVEVKDNAPAMPHEEVKYLGNNTRSITILAHSADATYLPEEHLAFLTKILGACKLNIGDVAIVNTANYPDTSAVINSLRPTQIILFGVQANTNGTNSVIAPDIAELIHETAEAKAAKSKLWSELKQMFGI